MKRFIFFATVLIDIAVSQSTYRAAVVEYAPKTSAQTYSNRILENIQEYVNYIGEAADEAIDIIVFPEYGLYGDVVNAENIDELSMEIPNPEFKISVCNLQNSNYSKALIDLSCAANGHRIYVVANIIEKHNASSNVTYYNTNIVFDREGALISRFRKINPYMEAHVARGNETVTFKTDFGVTFGMFICNDIMFQNPAMDVLSNSAVTDIIYSTAWTTELPFLESLSVQHGYAKSKGVNILVSELSDPANGYGGSGIFLANGKILTVYKTAAKSSRMLKATIPKTNRQNASDHPNQSHSANVDDLQEQELQLSPSMGGSLPNISKFFTHQQDLSNFTFKAINLTNNSISESICMGSYNQFCCSIDVTAKVNNEQNYQYKLAIFNGGHTLGWETIGIRTCALLACLNASESSCGLRSTTAPKGVTFESLTINASFPYVKNAHDQPVTVLFDLIPITNYDFTKEVANGRTELIMTVRRQTSLLIFGIFGRVYDNDHKGLGSFNNAAAYIISPYLVLIISVIIFVTQEK
ncbi:hypothetical protein FQR65_LT03153 [Abscondita terminalis]|nr:hypothetical protein FQR65_LT03153 [Abscondita terminalis]